jgi:hypothetical protein
MPAPFINCFLHICFPDLTVIRYALYQRRWKCKNITHEMSFGVRNTNPYWSNIELNSTPLSVVPGPMSSSVRHVALQCFVLVFPKILPYNGLFELRNLGIFWKMNLYQTVIIHENNLDCKVLIHMPQNTSVFSESPPLCVVTVVKDWTP